VGYCPYYSKACPHNDECEIWDTATSTCGIKRQKSLLELINLKGADSIASEAPAGKYKVTNMYVDPATGTLTVEYDDTPVE